MKDKRLLVLLIFLLTGYISRPQGCSKHLCLHECIWVPLFHNSVTKVPVADTQSCVRAPTYSLLLNFTTALALQQPVKNDIFFHHPAAKPLDMTRLFFDRTRSYMRLEVRGQNGERLRMKTSVFMRL